ncbi:LacI family DNA-binding transcriptional regulator [Roseomonas sp. NAR14]|uniref:LacI family DNA-binding transcriptional regulator n=1 Tax=Roseomonas acroporae TaxID=2937791 RepID=A0A9X1Y7B6_9PROT|nr:LacI family DNA-binding transcriptional regulator [Roseomonas acroporae]MCK8784447.1 LacI family DNA-binding transcriptional regulator [Roseomonas acroporae]
MDVPAPPTRPARARATLLSLAQAAGVSISTVSRALRGDARISPATRRRIDALAAEAGYAPNALARTLLGGRSGLIGLVLGPMQNPFYPALLEELVAQAAERGLRLLLLHAGEGSMDDRTAQALLQYQVDGCLVTSAALPSRIAAICAGNDVPLVMINRVAREHGAAVCCDNAEGGARLADFLLAGGHRRFAVVGGNADTSTSLDRERGFVERLAARGVALACRFDGGATREGGWAAGERIAAMPPGERPDAVFAVGDGLAMGLIDALRAGAVPVGASVEGEGVEAAGAVSVVGFDGVAAALRPPYALTTIVQPLRAVVRRGLDLLLARMEDPAAPDELVTLRGTLHVGRSARLPAGAATGASHGDAGRETG